MRKITVSEFVTQNGVMEDPGGAERSERGGRAFQFERGPAGDKFKREEVLVHEIARRSLVLLRASQSFHPGDAADDNALRASIFCLGVWNAVQGI